MYPNTFDIILQTGDTVSAGDADQTTRIDAPTSFGVFGGQDHSTLLDELFGLTGAAAVIPTLLQTSVLDTSGNGGVLDTDLTINLAAGLNVIDIVTGGNGIDFVLNNANLLIQGGADSFAIFRVNQVQEADFLISNSNVVVGNGGIGLNNVLFYSDDEDTGEHFNFDNTILNGIAFWDLGASGGEININDSQGCVQLVADKVTLNDVRYTRCNFTAVPEPGTGVLFALGVGALATIRLRSRVA